MDREIPEPEPLHDIPGYTEEANRRIEASEVAGGATLEDIPVGKGLRVETKSRAYTLEHRADGWYISGHPKHCPEPKPVIIQGSTFAQGGSMLKTGYVGRTMHLLYNNMPEPGTIPTQYTTSEIQNVSEITCQAPDTASDHGDHNA